MAANTTRNHLDNVGQKAHPVHRGPHTKVTPPGQSAAPRPQRGTPAPSPSSAPRHAPGRNRSACPPMSDQNC